MIRTRRTSHDPEQCRNALLGAQVAIIDLETTGVTSNDRPVAVGVLIDGVAFILFTENHMEISTVGLRLSLPQIRTALSPLTLRTDLVIVVHNALFDLGMLLRCEIEVRCRVFDTMKTLKLIDSDRVRESDQGSGIGIRTPRHNRRFQQSTNYKLKDISRHLLNIAPIEFPGSTAVLSKDRLTKYLKSDLLITRELFNYLQSRCSVVDTSYNESMIQPLAIILTRMSVTGVCADLEFIRTESQKLLDLMEQLDKEHRSRFGTGIKGDDKHLYKWIFVLDTGLRCLSLPRRIKGRSPTIRLADLKTLHGLASQATVKTSLSLIHDYRCARSLLIRLKTLEKHVHPTTGRIYSQFNDFQTSGRVSSSRPNLQQIAKAVSSGSSKGFLSDPASGLTIRSRNAIIASPGHQIVAFDISQADIRVLAHVVESFPYEATQYLERLREHRLHVLPECRAYQRKMWDYFQIKNRKPLTCPSCSARLDDSLRKSTSSFECPFCHNVISIPIGDPSFDPRDPCILANDFRTSDGDFYTVAAKRMLGKAPDEIERQHIKQTILGIVNGMSASGLAKRLNVSPDIAQKYLGIFANAYPQVAKFTELTRHAFAITGESATFSGRRRIVSPHSWMVTKPQVEIFMSYKSADKLWLKVIPIHPDRHVLTCWILSAVDAGRSSSNKGLEIYHHSDGRISQLPYKLFRDGQLIFRLPVRNIPWSNIRRIRTPSEEAQYDGYDKTWRQLLNHMFQGGTADISKIMMMRTEPICCRFNARLLLQIHDELVFEAPKRHIAEFTRSIYRTLQEPPAEDFKVPIVLSPKTGLRFGELHKVKPEALSD